MVSINRAIHSSLPWRRGVHLSSLRSVTALPSLQSLQGIQCSGQEIKPRGSAGSTTAFQCGACSVCTELYLHHHSLFMPQLMHVILGQETIDNMSFCRQCWKDRLESGRKKYFFSFLTCKITSHSKEQNFKEKKTVQNPRRKADKFRPHYLRQRPVIQGFSSKYGLFHFGTRNSAPALGLIPQLFPATGLGFNIGGSVV